MITLDATKPINDDCSPGMNPSVSKATIALAQSAYFGAKEEALPRGPIELDLNEQANRTTKVYDVVIVGAGVAGIFVSERLQREGYSVLLLDKHSELAKESSAEQHGWGQFGSLYLHMDDPKVSEACLHNVQLLMQEYSNTGCNLTAGPEGELISNNPHNQESWYREDPIYYYCPDGSDPELHLTPDQAKDWQQKKNLALYRTGVIGEHDWHLSHTPSLAKNEKEEKIIALKDKYARKWKQATIAHNPTGKMAARSERDAVINGDMQKYSVIESNDRPMRSIPILNAVHNRYVNEGGKDSLNTNITSWKENGEIVELTAEDGRTFLARRAIFTAGGGLRDVKGVNTKTVLSPLLVVSPAICDRNLVLLTPVPSRNINHLHHVDPITGKTYSIIGNSDGVAVGDVEGMEKSRQGIKALAESTFPSFAKDDPSRKAVVYFGHKNEVIPDKATLQRNYHYEVVPMKLESETNSAPKVFAAVPGKFTLSPSLADKMVKMIESSGLKPSPKTEESDPASELSVNAVSDQLHLQIVRSAIPEAEQAFRSGRNFVKRVSETK